MNPLTATKHIKKKQGDIKEQCLSGESERETYYYTRLRKKRKERKKKQVKIIELRAEFCMHAQCLIARIRDGERGGG